jgi:hypothetical protein
MDVYHWRTAEEVGRPTDTEKVSQLGWVPLGRVLGHARRQQILGAGALVSDLHFEALRVAHVLKRRVRPPAVAWANDEIRRASCLMRQGGHQPGCGPDSR